VFSALDKPSAVPRTLSQTKKFLEEGGDESESEDGESASSEDEFEDVPLVSGGKGGEGNERGRESEESEDEAWEDALGSKHHTK
jgi:xeroderma pigmentosum group C-complementing protein